MRHHAPIAPLYQRAVADKRHDTHGRRRLDGRDTPKDLLAQQTAAYIAARRLVGKGKEITLKELRRTILARKGIK